MYARCFRPTFDCYAAPTFSAPREMAMRRAGDVQEHGPTREQRVSELWDTIRDLDEHGADEDDPSDYYAALRAQRELVDMGEVERRAFQIDMGEVERRWAEQEARA